LAKLIHQVVPHPSRLHGVEAMTMLSGHAFPRHAHDHYGIGVVTAGAQKSWSALGRVESSVGDVIMVNPGEVHDGSPIDGVRGWHIVYLEPRRVLRELADEGYPKDPLFRPVAQDPALAAEVLRLLAALGDAQDGVHGAEESLLSCLLQVVQGHLVHGPRSARLAPAVNRAMEWIQSEPAAAVPLDALAACCGVSRFQLIRGFARDLGMTPHAYRVQLRVRQARRYLAEGDSIADAALKTGFADQSHLTRAFAKQFGITPGRYQATMG
jgi:AraC-like DNA-binding protein